jgi:hypothetical protein
MNARTCQLCGKPLSRLRVGADGDFCSREHRNQYRLRLGMDRLLEANKVASLMRRRENPLRLTAARLLCNSAISPRAFGAGKIPAARPEPGISFPAPVMATPHMAVATDNYLQPRSASQPGLTTVRRPYSSFLRISGRRTAPLLPSRKMKLSARLAQAQLAILRYSVRMAEPGRREFGMLAHTAIRVYVGGGFAGLRRLDPPGPSKLNKGQRARRIKTPPRKGNALRVSGGVGFRVPPVHLRGHSTCAAMRAALVLPQNPYPAAPGMVSYPAAPRASRLKIGTAGVSSPASPKARAAAQFQYPGAINLAQCMPNAGAKLRTRALEAAWHALQGEITVHAIRMTCPPPQGFAARNGVHLFNLVLSPAVNEAVQKLAVAPITPQESLVGYPPISLHGTLTGALASHAAPSSAAGPVAVPSPEAPAPPPRLEEHFDAGWDNWVGGMADWLVDVAGVRTGSLALFSPSLDLIDYDLEFLARIDHHSVNWIVRASNFQEYCLCSITVVPGEGFQFSRRVVFAGTPEPPVAASDRIVTSKPKAALTISTSLHGSNFAVSVDGKRIDSWTEDRLPIGGVGFIGAPDDRARLYWVRLAPAAIIGKEYQKR